VALYFFRRIQGGAMDKIEKRYIQVSISPTLKARLKAAAQSRGLQPTELIRFLVVDYCDREFVREDVWGGRDTEAANVP
jgi:hypothetical protein